MLPRSSVATLLPWRVFVYVPVQRRDQRCAPAAPPSWATKTSVPFASAELRLRRPKSA